jgi:hypothetical protein
MSFFIDRDTFIPLLFVGLNAFGGLARMSKIAA